MLNNNKVQGEYSQNTLTDGSVHLQWQNKEYREVPK